MNQYVATSNDTLLTTTELMQKLGRSRNTICAWARAGKIPAIRMPDGNYAFNSGSIEQWLSRRTTGPVPRVA